MSEQSELDELNRVLGRRLAEIRREAGLTQAQLAVRLRGTNRGWQQAVSRFEQGKAGQQSLFFILDYLRACGKCLRAVMDVLTLASGTRPGSRFGPSRISRDGYGRW